MNKKKDIEHVLKVSLLPSAFIGLGAGASAANFDLLRPQKCICSLSAFSMYAAASFALGCIREECADTCRNYLVFDLYQISSWHPRKGKRPERREAEKLVCGFVAFPSFRPDNGEYDNDDDKK